jgi:hypothetical protein
MYDFLPEKLLRLVYGTFNLAMWILFTRASGIGPQKIIYRFTFFSIKDTQLDIVLNN